MKLGAQDRDKIIRTGVISGGLLIVAIYGYFQLSTPDAPPPLVAPVVTTSSATRTASPALAATPSAGVVVKSAKTESASKVGTTAAQYDPTLRMEPMLVTESLVYSGSGRNIFSASSVPVAPAFAPAVPGNQRLVPSPTVCQARNDGCFCPCNSLCHREPESKKHLSPR